MVNREEKHLILSCQRKLPEKKDNTFQHRRTQMIAEHGKFFSQNTCAMLESLSTYNYYHICQNYSKKGTMI